MPSFFTTSKGNSLASSHFITLGAISRAAKSRISRRSCSCSSVSTKGYRLSVFSSSTLILGSFVRGLTPALLLTG